MVRKNDKITIEEGEVKLNNSRSSRQWVKLRSIKEIMRYTCRLSMLQERDVLREVLKVLATTQRLDISRSITIMPTLGQTTPMEARDLIFLKPATQTAPTQMVLTQTVEVVPSARIIKAVAATTVMVSTSLSPVVAPLKSSNQPRN